MSDVRVLVVDDSADTREMLAVFLNRHGYAVVVARCAAEGLERLRAGGYHLVLTDYAMPPGETGASMLRRAESGGHLRDVAAIMYTSAESPERLPDVRLVPKGSDLSVLLRAMDDALSRVREEDMRRTRESLEQRTSRASALGTPVARVELVLYVSASSPLSHRALQQLKNLLSEYDESSIDAVVRDLAHDPAAADADGVAFTPTLVVRRPGPPEWFLGDLREPDVLRDRFAAAGVKRRVVSVESEGGARGGP